MSNITKKDLLERIEILEKKEKQRGIGNNFMTLKCIQGNRTFTKDVTYAASKTFDSIVITNNFGSVRILEENTNIFGGYKVPHDTQTAVFQVIGADVEPEPKLKVLDQSVFDDLDEKWRFLAVDFDGETNFFERTPKVSMINGRWYNPVGSMKLCGSKYDNSNWQNSLIERDKVEKSDHLDGIISNIVDELLDSEYFYSKIACELLSKGCSYVLAYVSDVSEQDAMKNKEVAVIDSVDVLLNDTDGDDWKYAVPINQRTGEPLTAADVDL